MIAATTSEQLSADLTAMCGVWRDHLRARDGAGRELFDDPHGGAPGAFPYENLVYVDFDGERYIQTNVVLSGRAPHQRTFTATVTDDVLRFDVLGPDAPAHVGISGGPGLIWFVAEHIADAGVGRYAEPDLIRIEGERRWRNTVLWRHGELARVLDVSGERLGTDVSQPHELDPRGRDAQVHGERSVTKNYSAVEQNGAAR